MPYGWEGNCRSGVALAMHHRLQWFIHLQAQMLNGLREGDEHPANTPVRRVAPFTLIYFIPVQTTSNVSILMAVFQMTHGPVPPRFYFLHFRGREPLWISESGVYWQDAFPDIRPIVSLTPVQTLQNNKP